MGIYSRVLDETIRVLGRSGYTEGSKADLSMQHFIEICRSHQGKVFEGHNGQKKKDRLQKPDWPPMGKMSHPL